MRTQRTIPNMLKGVILPLLFLITASTFAQEVQPDSVVVDSLEVAVAEEDHMYKGDTADFVYFVLPTELEYIPGDDAPSLMADRLACIESTMPLIYNERVHAFINFFTVKDREYTRMMMRRKNLYFPLFEKYLAKYGLPEELKYLSIIESGLNPRAMSRVRAVGLWQFMSATGRYYGLNNDWYIDDRMDPEKSTEAACRYLRDLIRNVPRLGARTCSLQYGSWQCEESNPEIGIQTDILGNLSEPST